MALSENIVPHRNVIGRMTKLLNAFIFGRSLTIVPAATPSIEKTKVESITIRISHTEICMSPLRKWPRTVSNSPQRLPFTTPSTALPSMIEDFEIGQSISSSKLS